MQIPEILWWEYSRQVSLDRASAGVHCLTFTCCVSSSVDEWLSLPDLTQGAERKDVFEKGSVRDGRAEKQYLEEKTAHADLLKTKIQHSFTSAIPTVEHAIKIIFNTDLKTILHCKVFKVGYRSQKVQEPYNQGWETTFVWFLSTHKTSAKKEHYGGHLTKLVAIIIEVTCIVSGFGAYLCGLPKLREYDPGIFVYWSLGICIVANPTYQFYYKIKFESHRYEKHYTNGEVSNTMESAAYSVNVCLNGQTDWSCVTSTCSDILFPIQFGSFVRAEMPKVLHENSDQVFGFGTPGSLLPPAVPGTIMLMNYKRQGSFHHYAVLHYKL
ncbi:hypothetical protein MG293_012165 [Ovis ammon polii]|uniref:Uncharacterized protein n=1 Tax=Ovis ammon polii TaxID=230172 RepID=A0AAD4U026_OVIAM|nr:hypothetical protein MG293_012165 [Ovis ammon polii]